MKLHLPHEHGAWVQLGFTLAGALLLGTPSLAAFALALVAALAFWAHEPLAVALGLRGARHREAHGAEAMKLLAILVTSAGALLLFAVSQLPSAALVALHPPIVLGAFVVVLAAARHERTTHGELLASAALAAWAVPIARAGGVSGLVALEVWLAFAVSYAMSTLAVRSVIQHAKPKKGYLRVLAACVAPLGAAFLFALSAAGHLPPLLPWAVVPAALFTLWLAIAPPHPRQLTRIGWGLTAACMASTALVVVALR